ncbi:hypothetical protein GN244_ATG08289 [Phytophthora infestans]|uniref:Uncharacterized protein n=1 Tax=Phytophthora infestans TaxID=4787 RepID=A0A833SVI4_PHYIN|nr:hypothetical protein GN244_ATG08289 [Phytophthora infestans]
MTRPELKTSSACSLYFVSCTSENILQCNSELVIKSGDHSRLEPEPHEYCRAVYSKPALSGADKVR